MLHSANNASTATLPQNDTWKRQGAPGLASVFDALSRRTSPIYPDPVAGSAKTLFVFLARLFTIYLCYH